MAKPSGDFGVLRHLWKSPWTLWVGLRYLKAKKNSRFLSFITILSMIGVCLGVTAMIVVLSVMDGFEAELRKRLMATDLHILITPTPDTSGFESGFVPKSSFDPSPFVTEGVSIWPITAAEAILKSRTRVSGVVVKGIDPKRMERLRPQITETADPQFLVQHEGPETIRLPSLFVGQELAYEMGLIPGEQVTLISPTETEGPLESVPRMKRFVVEGIYKTGLPEQELHTLYAEDKAMRSFLRKSEVVSQWEATLEDFDLASSLARRIQVAVPTLKVQDWKQLNSHIFASLRLERVAMFVILAFIIVVASFNIVTTLTLMVAEKKREIAIMKAMGARHGQVAAIFLAEGILIGLIGVGSGVVLGGLLCIGLRRWNIVELPEIFYDRTLPVTFDPVYYIAVAVSALAIVLIACLYPSRRAARLAPLDGIRFG